MAKSEIVFLSHCISEKTPSYGNRDYFINKFNSSFKKGDKAETSNWVFSNNHFGTHIDVPRHFVPEGKTITDYHADFWVFKKVACIEFDCKNAVLINAADITGFNIDKDVDLLLIKTNYEQFRGTEKYWKENPGIAPELVSHLKQKHPFLRAVGFDFISVTSFQHRPVGRETHLAFLDGDRPVLPIEDMTLSRVNKSSIFEEVIVAPFMVSESNGAPVTVIAKIQTQVDKNRKIRS